MKIKVDPQRFFASLLVRGLPDAWREPVMEALLDGADDGLRARLRAPPEEGPGVEGQGGTPRRFFACPCDQGPWIGQCSGCGGRIEVRPLGSRPPVITTPEKKK